MICSSWWFARNSSLHVKGFYHRSDGVLITIFSPWPPHPLALVQLDYDHTSIDFRSPPVFYCSWSWYSGWQSYNQDGTWYDGGLWSLTRSPWHHVSCVFSFPLFPMISLIHSTLYDFFPMHTIYISWYDMMVLCQSSSVPFNYVSSNPREYHSCLLQYLGSRTITGEIRSKSWVFGHFCIVQWW